MDSLLTKTPAKAEAISPLCDLIPNQVPGTVMANKGDKIKKHMSQCCVTKYICG